MFSFKEAGYCATKITGKAGTGRPRRFFRLYPTTRACGKRSTLVMRKYRLKPHKLFLSATIHAIATLTVHALRGSKRGSASAEVACLWLRWRPRHGFPPRNPSHLEISPKSWFALRWRMKLLRRTIRKFCHMFRSRRKTPKGSQTRLYVETKDALAAMLIADQRSSPFAAATESRNDHLDWLSRILSSFARRGRAKKKTKIARCVS